jgi:hypothetical protein
MTPNRVNAIDDPDAQDSGIESNRPAVPTEKSSKDAGEPIAFS